jgi:dihydrofolate synthase/folylpolyglutamate synthase
MRDKHVDEMASELFPLASRVIATRVRMKRAATTQYLFEVAKKLGVTAIEEASISRALARSARVARPGETVVVAGSLYLVGAVRKRLLGARAAKGLPAPGGAASRSTRRRSARVSKGLARSHSRPSRH